jgi:outer membrane murein-binding lipoprotein Lpp
MTAFLAPGDSRAAAPVVYFKEIAMSSQFTSRFWKWVVPAGITVGLLGLWAPAGADDEKVEVKIKKEGDQDRKDGEGKDAKKEGERKEEGRKDGDRKEEFRKDQPRKGEGQGHNDARIDELSKIVKQLAGQVNELREEVRGLRSGGFAGGPNPEEYRKRMEEMTKKFGAGFPGGGISPAKMKEEMERRFKEQKERVAREGGFPGGDAEANIRREIERLNGELKRIIAAREGGDKVEKKEPKKEGGDRKEGSDAEAREAKERAAKREGKEREAKERDAKERESKEDKKPDAK